MKQYTSIQGEARWDTAIWDHSRQVADLNEDLSTCLFLTPWEPVTGERARYLEEELARELAPHHALCGRRIRAVAITVESDDVLFQFDHGGAMVQVHLTYTKDPPEMPGLPRHQMFDHLADWMIEKMIADHVDRLGLWEDGW